MLNCCMYVFSRPFVDVPKFALGRVSGECLHILATSTTFLHINYKYIFKYILFLFNFAFL